MRKAFMQGVGRPTRGEMCEAGPGEEGICTGLEVRGDPFTQCWNKVWKVMLGKAAHHRDLEPKKGDEGFLNRNLNRAPPGVSEPGQGEGDAPQPRVVVA